MYVLSVVAPRESAFIISRKMFGICLYVNIHMSIVADALFTFASRRVAWVKNQTSIANGHIYIYMNMSHTGRICCLLMRSASSKHVMLGRNILSVVSPRE